MICISTDLALLSKRSAFSSSDSKMHEQHEWRLRSARSCKIRLDMIVKDQVVKA